MTFQYRKMPDYRKVPPKTLSELRRACIMFHYKELEGWQKHLVDEIDELSTKERAQLLRFVHKLGVIDTSHIRIEQESPSAGVPLDEIKQEKRWVAWRVEDRNGKPTKVPYCSAEPEREAEPDNSTTWLSHVEAETCAQRLNGGQGVGLMLGARGDQWIAGIDLDTCQDPHTGKVEAWAQEVISRFATYAEVSPSGAGIKLFFLIDPADIEPLRQVMGTQHGRQWKRANGKDHPPAIELYISHRYFVVTWRRLPETPAGLCSVPLDSLRWLTEEAGPALKGEQPRATNASRGEQGERSNNDTVLGRLQRAAETNKGLATALQNAATMRGGSRSEGALGIGAALRRLGWSYEDMKAALLGCRATREWAAEQDERQFERIWEKGDTGDRQQHARAEPEEPNKHQPPPLRVTSAAWDPAEVPRRPWVAEGYLLRRAVTLIVGAPSAFKSTLALYYAVAIVLGRPFGDFVPIVSGKVIVYNVEEDIDEQHRRLEAILAFFNATPADIAGKLILVETNLVGTCWSETRTASFSLPQQCSS